MQIKTKLTVGNVMVEFSETLDCLISTFDCYTRPDSCDDVIFDTSCVYDLDDEDFYIETVVSIMKQYEQVDEEEITQLRDLLVECDRVLFWR